MWVYSKFLTATVSVAHDQFFCFLRKCYLANFVFGRFWNFISLKATLSISSLPRIRTILLRNYLFVPLRQFLVEVAFILDRVDLFNESKFHVVVYVQKLESLADLHLEVIVCLFKFWDVHVLELLYNRQFALFFTHLRHLREPVEDDFLLIFG